MQLNSKWIIFLLACLFLFQLSLSSFEFTLLYYQSPLKGIGIELKAHQLLWEYLLKQHYISLIDLDCLTLHEKRHLLDVKRVFETLDRVWIVASFFSLVFFLIIFVYDRKRLFQLLQYTFSLGLFVVILALVITMSFSQYFTLLHLWLFPQNSWIFPEESLLIRWFPLEYFQEFFGLVLCLLILQLLLLRYLKKSMLLKVV
ncbi:MAG TPA: DUF1461 domain-containing protein [Campylobacterales bacterium]|nr:DUF1461 domain-containing protein [Campylobacterales bacterium]